MSKHALLNDRRTALPVNAEPTFAGLDATHPEFIGGHVYGPYGAIEVNNNAYAVGRMYFEVNGVVKFGVAFEATKFAARAVARAGFNVYQIRESRYIANRGRVCRA